MARPVFGAATKGFKFQILHADPQSGGRQQTLREELIPYRVQVGGVVTAVSAVFIKSSKGAPLLLRPAS